MLINERGKVIQILDKKDRENSNVGVFKKNGHEEQLFDLVYVDEMPAEPKKGELNKDFGLKVEMPFFVVSGLKTERYLDFLARNLVIKRPNGRPSQLWWFDQKTKTIKSW